MFSLFTTVLRISLYSYKFFEMKESQDLSEKVKNNFFEKNVNFGVYWYLNFKEHVDLVNCVRSCKKMSYWYTSVSFLTWEMMIMNFKIWGIHSHLMEVEIEEMDQEVENKGQLATGSQEIVITLSGICNSSLSTGTCIFSNATFGMCTS